jgi:catechol 2,3-dioxygenase-like lactoylglutathione lyase family enzyme
MRGKSNFMIAFRQIKETCLYVRNLAEVKDFYGTLLGLPVIDYQEGKHLFLRVGNSVLLCFNPDDSRKKVSPPAHYAEGKQHIAFEVSEQQYEIAKEYLKTNGVAITNEVVWKSGKQSFYFEDPAGNILEVVPDAGIWD